MSRILRLPKAPNEYNINDQDFVRRLIMDAINDLQATVDGLGTGATVTESKIIYDGRVILGSVNTGINDGDSIGQPLIGWVKGNTGDASWGNMFQQISGAANNGTLNVYNGRRTIQPKPSATVDGLWLWRPGTSGQNPIPFSDTFFTLSGSSAGTLNPSPSVSIEAFVRKTASGDGSDCRFFLGFTYVRIINPTKPIARIGLLGDGNGGYRFGSVNCPDGGTSSTQNAATDVDANNVDPSELSNANLGTDWFKVRIKLIPPTPTQSGRWGAYLNGNLIATFTTTTNFPRGYFSGSQINDGYRAIECGFGAYADGTVIVPSPALEGIRVLVEEDWTLPATI